jgi:predicted transcriptional regulator
MTEIITIRLDRAEKKAVQKLAGKSGASRWVKGLIQAQLRSQPKGLLAEHEAWLATQTVVVDDDAILDWFRKNRR